MHAPNALIALEPVCFSPFRRRWSRAQSFTRFAPSTMKLVTWNVDFMAPSTSERVTAVLSYLRNTLSASSLPPKPCCILLQEIASQAFPSILAHDWVRKHFTVVPSSPAQWPHHSPYGNVTLVSRDLPIISAQSLFFGNSRMGRNALIVDVLLSDVSTESIHCIRIANTHLESLPQGGHARPVQLAAISQMFKDPCVGAGVVGGDMNMIIPSDAHIHRSASLHDAYRSAESEEGHTWGYQPRSQFPPGRLDRIFYRNSSSCGLRVDHPMRLGVGRQTTHGLWLSDHYGLLTTLSIESVS